MSFALQIQVYAVASVTYCFESFNKYSYCVGVGVGLGEREEIVGSKRLCV